jgi:CRP-like cAMP-binding protein
MNTGNGGHFGFSACGPNIVAPGLWGVAGNPGQVLTEQERAELAVISTVVRFARGDILYREGDSADAVFNLIGGVVKSYRGNGDGSHDIAGFLFPGDLIGLALDGAYVNTAEAIAATTAYRIPAPALETKLRRSAALEFNVICKLCHELREAQRHAFLLTRRHALAKVGLFLEMLESHQAGRGKSAEEIYLPMTRSDIGGYIGTSLEAVSRSFRALADRRIVAFRNRHHVKILDRSGLAAIVSAG